MDGFNSFNLLRASFCPVKFCYDVVVKALIVKLQIDLSPILFSDECSSWNVERRRPSFLSMTSAASLPSRVVSMMLKNKAFPIDETKTQWCDRVVAKKRFLKLQNVTGKIAR